MVHIYLHALIKPFMCRILQDRRSLVQNSKHRHDTYRNVRSHTHHIFDAILLFINRPFECVSLAVIRPRIDEDDPSTFRLFEAASKTWRWHRRKNFSQWMLASNHKNIAAISPKQANFSSPSRRPPRQYLRLRIFASPAKNHALYSCATYFQVAWRRRFNRFQHGHRNKKQDWYMSTSVERR